MMLERDRAHLGMMAVAVAACICHIFDLFWYFTAGCIAVAIFVAASEGHIP